MRFDGGIEFVTRKCTYRGVEFRYWVFRRWSFRFGEELSGFFIVYSVGLLLLDGVGFRVFLVLWFRAVFFVCEG